MPAPLMLVNVYDLADIYHVLPWTLKQLPRSELNEMVHMHNLRNGPLWRTGGKSGR